MAFEEILPLAKMSISGGTGSDRARWLPPLLAHLVKPGPLRVISLMDRLRSGREINLGPRRALDFTFFSNLFWEISFCLCPSCSPWISYW